MELMHRHYSCAPQYTLPARSPGSTSLFTPSLTTHTRIVLPSSSPLTHTHTPRTAPNLSFLPPPLPPLSQRPGKQMTRKEIMDMIWEVDEDLDDMISWSEFEAMYVRRKRARERERERERHRDRDRETERCIYRKRCCVCIHITLLPTIYTQYVSYRTLHPLLFLLFPQVRTQSRRPVGARNVQTIQRCAVHVVRQKV